VPPDPAQTSVLDNVVWHALRGPLAGFAEPGTDARVVRFDPEIAVFWAVDVVDEASWKALAKRAGVGGMIALARHGVPPAPRGWTETFREAVCQLVADALPPAPDCGAIALGPEDAEEMLALAQLTEPGPFLGRTCELGGYLGIRREGRLIAMAGQRFRVPGYREISAVCTHPDVRREGLGTALTLNVAEAIREAGDEAFLHVLESNQNARRLYESLGFKTRRRTEVVAAVWQSPDL
jgi:ribosomal protein S18 acetylase RimI-like enzyme